MGGQRLLGCFGGDLGWSEQRRKLLRVVKTAWFSSSTPAACFFGVVDQWETGMGGSGFYCYGFSRQWVFIAMDFLALFSVM